MQNQTLARITGWMPGFQIRESVWKHYKATGRAHYTAHAPGEFAPPVPNPSWSLRLAASEQLEQARCRMCCRGVRMELPGGPGVLRAEVCLLPGGVLAGRLPDGMSPTLFSLVMEDATEAQGFQMVRDGDMLITLGKESKDGGVRFALGRFPAGDPEGAMAAISGILRQADPGRELDEEFRWRDEAFPVRENDDACGLAAFELLIAALRPRTGRIHGAWCATPSEHGEVLGLNEAVPQILAWAALDPEVAVELIQTCASFQRPQGLFPSHVSPDPDRHPPLSCMWPVFARLCAECLPAFRDPATLEPLAPKLAEYAREVCEGFGQDQDTLPVWPSADDALIAESWDEQVAPVALTSMLVAEVDALRDIFSRFESGKYELPRLTEARDRLISALFRKFWNPRERIYMDCLPQGDEGETWIRRLNLGCYLPVALNDLPADHRVAVIEHMDDPKSLLGADGISLWQAWPEDEMRPRMDALVHGISFLLVSHHTPARARFRKSLEAAQRHLFSAGAFFPRDLNPEPSGGAPGPALDACAAALHLVTTGSDQTPESIMETAPAPVRFLDRHRMAATLVAVSLFLIVLLGVPLVLINKSAHRGVASHLKGAQAERAYLMGNYREAISIHEELRSETTDPTLLARHAAGIARCHFRMGEYAQAAEWYANAHALDTNQVVVCFNHAITLFKLGRYTEALDTLELTREMGEKRMPEILPRVREAVRYTAEQKAIKEGL